MILTGIALTWVTTTFSMSLILSPFSNIVIAAVIEQTDAANVHGLLADLDLAPAHVDVGVAEHG